MPLRAHAFVDGAYLCKLANELGEPWPNPAVLARKVVEIRTRDWCGTGDIRSMGLARTVYFDGRPDDSEQVDERLQAYWSAVELSDDSHVEMGSVRRGAQTSKYHQKGVDVLLAVRMLSGAHHRIFDVAILVSGDEDFAPVVEEVQRHGVMVTVVAGRHNLASRLRIAADRVVELPWQGLGTWPALRDSSGRLFDHELKGAGPHG